MVAKFNLIADREYAKLLDDQTHSHAIRREIGEHLRTVLREQTDLPPNLERKMQQLRALDEAPSISPHEEKSATRSARSLAEIGRLLTWWRRKS